jgi:hypothetical protein
MLWTPAISIRTDQPLDLKIATYADLSHLIRLGNDKQNDLSLSFHIKSFRIINDTKK